MDVKNTAEPARRPYLTDRYIAGVNTARLLHGADVRKGTTIPYLSHLLSVSALVLEHGGDEDQAIAALLHDAAEDHGGQARLDAIRADFGTRVATIVEACSDSLVEDPSTKAPWFQRKVTYLEHLSHTPRDAVLVSAADKLHNARAILSDVRRHGDDLWNRFNPASGWAGSCWYYNALATVLGDRLRGQGEDAEALAGELRRTVDAIRNEIRTQHADVDEVVAQFSTRAAAASSAS